MPVMIAPRLHVSRRQRGELERLSRSSSLPHRTVMQASALLLAADGVANRRSPADSTTIPTRCDGGAASSKPGLRWVGPIAPGRGRKSWMPRTSIDAIVRRHVALVRRRVDALDDPDHGRAPRRRQGHRGPDLEEPQPASRGRSRPSRSPTTRDFEEKLVDVVGLYLNPPERAVVFSFDEKTQVQALDRTQPSLPHDRRAGEGP